MAVVFVRVRAPAVRVSKNKIHRALLVPPACGPVLSPHVLRTHGAQLACARFSSFFAGRARRSPSASATQRFHRPRSSRDARRPVPCSGPREHGWHARERLIAVARKRLSSQASVVHGGAFSRGVSRPCGRRAGHGRDARPMRSEVARRIKVNRNPEFPYAVAGPKIRSTVSKHSTLPYVRWCLWAGSIPLVHCTRTADIHLITSSRHSLRIPGGVVSCPVIGGQR